MREFGAVNSANWRLLFTAVINPWILTGIGFLIGFLASYVTALSWADLSYVSPATAISYVLMALLAKVFLHEHVTRSHWLGIALITLGVGFVATAPSLTVPPEQGEQPLHATPAGSDA